MLREFTPLLRLAVAPLTTRAAVVFALALTVAALPGCGIKGPLKPAPPAAVPASPTPAPPAAVPALPEKPVEPPPPAAPALPATGKP